MVTTCTSPDKNCAICPRLAQFRTKNKKLFPDKFNAPVPAFGSADPALLVVGLAPGLRGANFTGRPFTGDYAGDLLYPTLIKFGFAKGRYDERADDGVTLINARITNAVRCVPPQNKPTPDEIKKCLPFLQEEIRAFRKMRVIIALGTIAHQSVLRATGHKQSAFKFAHGATYDLGKKITLIDSYHCSRYNVNTKRLTAEMFEDIFAKAKKIAVE